MKSSWKETTVGQVLQLEYGRPLDEAHRKPDGSFPVYGANGEKDHTDQYYYSKSSIIVGRKGSAGEINLTEAKFWPLDVTYFVTFDEKQYDLRFLYYLLETLNLPKLAKGVKPGINRSEVYSLAIRVPVLAEQKRIVSVLDEAFEGIESAKANAEKNLQNASDLFDSILQSIFGRNEKDWQLKTLSEVSTTFGRGKSKHRPRNAPYLYGGKYPFIQTGDIRNADHVISEYSQTYSEAGLAQSKLWPKGTICITIAANIAETAILGFDACFPDSVIGMVVNPREADTGFIEYLLQSFKAVLQAKGKGSAQDNINLGTFEDERFPFPTVKKQKEIVLKLDELRETVRKLESVYKQKLSALKELRKSLLHQAFTGQL
jgi:type I restriction enzyme S subunit